MRKPTAPADDPQLMEKVFLYVSACERRHWRPVFTLEQFRAIYQAVIADPSIPNTDALPTDRDRVTLYGVAITVSSAPRPPMPEDMLDRDSPLSDEDELRVRQDQAKFNRAMAMLRPPGDDLTDPAVQAERMYGPFPPAPYRSGYTDGSFEAHDQPPRSM